MHKDITTNNLEMMRLRWKNRRRITWITFIFIILETIYLIVSEDISTQRLEALTPVIGWSYGTGMGIISAYFGFSTWDDIKQQNEAD